MIGSIIVLVFGIVSMVYGISQYPGELKILSAHYGIWNIGCGIFGLIGLRMSKSKKKGNKVSGNLLLLIFGIGAGITMISWFIGPALMIIGAIVGFIELKKH